MINYLKRYINKKLGEILAPYLASGYFFHYHTGYYDQLVLCSVKNGAILTLPFTKTR